MNLTIPEGQSLARAVADAAARRPEVEVAVCPSFTALHAVGTQLSGTQVSLGAQDVFWIEKGAFTGQVSPAMLLDAGCKYCIVGHSEKRGRFGAGELPKEQQQYFSDTDEIVAKKLSAAIYVGIAPILCVGETETERSQGKTESVITAQLDAALRSLAPEECALVSIAYEPVWAIGTGKVCEPDEAERVCALIRSHVGGLADSECSETVRVLYGGSVKADNSATLLKQPSIDGALVGGASLIADEFSRIIFSA